ncbi:MAG TPA: glycosyltransferase family A protein, partial [Polyangiaceae bacterium]
MPGVSVVVPVYNGEKYLREALESIFHQTLAPLEVIVVDDGSTDLSAEIAHAFDIRYCYCKNGGHARALNTGVAMSSGQYLAFLDADDRWVPEKLAIQLAVLSHQSEVDVVCGHARQFTEPVATAHATEAILPARLPSAMLMRRCTWERVGPFPEQFRIGSALEWCARADDRGIVWCMLQQVVYERRVHASNLTLTHATTKAEYAWVLKQVLNARRRSSGARDGEDMTVTRPVYSSPTTPMGRA